MSAPAISMTCTRAIVFFIGKISAGQSQRFGSEHAGRGPYDRGELYLQRRQAGRLDDGRDQRSTLFRPTDRPCRSEIRLAEIHLGHRRRATSFIKLDLEPAARGCRSSENGSCGNRFMALQAAVRAKSTVGVRREKQQSKNPPSDRRVSHLPDVGLFCPSSSSIVRFLTKRKRLPLGVGGRVSPGRFVPPVSQQTGFDFKSSCQCQMSN